MFTLVSIVRIIILQVIAFLLMNSFELSAQGSNELRLEFSGGKVHSIPIIKINDKVYFNLNKYYNTIFAGSRIHIESGQISFGDYSLKVTPASFFIVGGRQGDQTVVQMNLPALLVKDEILIPIVPFFNAISQFGIYDIKIRSERSIFINDLHSKPQEMKFNINEPSKQSDDKERNSGSLDKKVISSRDTFKLPSLKPEGSKKTQANDNPDFLPNQYILPQDLQRKEIIRPSGSKYLIDTNSRDGANRIYNNDYIDASLFASNSIMQEKGKFNFISFKSVTYTGRVDIILSSDAIIENYQKPEYKDGKLILRIPDALNLVKNCDLINVDYFVRGVEVEYIRNFLLYKMKPIHRIDSMSSRRNGQRELIYSIYFGETAQSDLSSVTSKDSESDIKNTKALETESIFGEKWKLDVIVIDPGHGGEDPGAISISGYQEKDLALSIALELRKLLNANIPDLKVVMTRENDKFVELFNRGKIANQANGKLFVSIHLNSMPKKPHHAKGFETYILRPGRNEDAIRVANKENSVIKYEPDQTKYKSMKEEDIILATIAQSGFVKLSELFAKILQEEVGKTTPMSDRGVNQAGFYVLVGASMPNVLFEAGFLSNSEDEKFLISEVGQKKVAAGLFNAIKRYSSEYTGLLRSERK